MYSPLSDCYYTVNLVDFDFNRFNFGNFNFNSNSSSNSNSIVINILTQIISYSNSYFSY